MDTILTQEKNAGTLACPNKIVFHLGFPKTGSTTIQETLRINRDFLMEHGIVVSPRDTLTRKMRLASIAFTRKNSLFRKLRVSREATLLARTIRRMSFKNLVISDENLIGTESARLFADDNNADYGAIIEKLDSLLRGQYDVLYIVYMRDREKWRASCYNQTIKRVHHTKSYHEWTVTNRNLSGPDVILEQISACLGDRLTVVDMMDENDQQGILGQNVLYMLGISPQELESIQVPSFLNQSLKPTQVEFIRMLGDVELDANAQRKVAQVVRKRPQLFSGVGKK